MTVRTYDEKVRSRILASIKRQLDAEAVAADAPSPPSIKVVPGAEAVYNDPELTARLVAALRKNLGADSAVEMPSKTTSEDFSEYGRAGVRTALLHIGLLTRQCSQRVPDIRTYIPRSGLLKWNPHFALWSQRKSLC